MTEMTPGPAWMKALGVLLVASFGGMIALTVLLAAHIGAGLAILTMLPAILVLILGLFLLTAGIRVSMSDHVELRFIPIWSCRIDYVDISAVRVEDQSWYRFGGIGLRWRRGATGLLLDDRSALVIRTRQDHEYVIQCRDPEWVATRLRDLLSEQ